ncbi:MAG: TIM barrel protein [Herpetosiphonaceae bacterium]|nr:TIM barrel protein [Herpetosiphonaceae bacterium]
MLFTDRPFLDRLDAVQQAGFEAFEFWSWRDKDLSALRTRQQASGLTAAALVLDTGQPLVAAPQPEVIRRAVQESLAAARQLDCQTLICTVSDPGGGEILPGVPRPEQHHNIVAGLKLVAPLAEEAGVTIVLEPLNILVDHPGYYLTSSAEGFDIIREVSSPAVKLLFDIYHQQITEGNLLSNLLPNLDLIGHFHIADVPGRHEPGSGEINYRNVLHAIDAAGYHGFVGLEYRERAAAGATLPAVIALAQ